ncbi:MAG TPA: xanthine dehydrogenase family protein molybdopterin-binding subunit [bacterium]|nr:xanthine dehydrogenase family protein molybdopterin-binding subunit [bacterium]
MALTIVGQSLPRVDAQEKLTGRAVFTADHELRGLLHGRLVLSPHAHAKIRRVPVEAANAIPGVVAVLTAGDLPFGEETPNARGRCLLARGEARFPGEPVAAVLAESEAAAADGAARLAAAIEYDPLPALIDPVTAADRTAPLVQPGLAGRSAEGGLHAAVSVQEEHEDAPGNVASQVKFVRGDIERGLRDSAVVARRTFRTAVVHQAYIEPHASIAEYDRAARRLTVWTATQGLFYTREQVAGVLGLPESSVRIVPMPVGGGFGGKILLLEPIAGALAMLSGRPVRLVLTRAEEFQTATPAPQSVLEVALGAGRDGDFRALQARLLFDAGALPGAPVTICAMLMGGAYRIPHLDLRGREVLTHKPPQGAYRAPGSVQAAFALECLVDEVADTLGQDPVELRLRNVSREGDPMPNGETWPRIGLHESLAAVRESRLWRERPARGSARGRRPGAALAGTGVAVGGWLGGLEAASACIRPNTDGTLHIVVGSVDISGTATALAQIAAETLGVPMRQVRLVSEDSDGAPQSGMSGGSKITYTVGSAVQKAAADARRQILALAAKRLEAAEADLEIVEGTVRVRGVPSRAVAVADVIKMTSGFGAQHAPVFGVASEAITTRAPAFGAHVAAVDVDADSGRVRVTGYAAAQDVGRAINPALVRGQIHGGVAQGIGWALFEQMVYDEGGTLTTATFADYALPRSTEVPPVDVQLVEVPSPRGPFGAKGVGEPPVVPVAAAIANAIADASGARLDTLPITPQRVVAALASRDGRRP